MSPEPEESQPPSESSLNFWLGLSAGCFVNMLTERPSDAGVFALAVRDIIPNVFFFSFAWGGVIQIIGKRWKHSPDSYRKAWNVFYYSTILGWILLILSDITQYTRGAFLFGIFGILYVFIDVFSGKTKPV